jgi:hypothetical protein
MRPAQPAEIHSPVFTRLPCGFQNLPPTTSTISMLYD